MEITTLAKLTINNGTYTVKTLTDLQPLYYFVVNGYPYVASASITLKECVRRLNVLLEERSGDELLYQTVHAGITSGNGIYSKMIGTTDVKIISTTINLSEILNFS